MGLKTLFFLRIVLVFGLFWIPGMCFVILGVSMTENPVYTKNATTLRLYQVGLYFVSNSYTFTSKPLGISLASVAGAIVVKKVKRPGCPIGVGHTLTSVNGKDVVALKWALADVFAELKVSDMPIAMTFAQ